MHTEGTPLHGLLRCLQPLILCLGAQVVRIRQRRVQLLEAGQSAQRMHACHL
jgi:hypothetical protein